MRVFVPFFAAATVALSASAAVAQIAPGSFEVVPDPPAGTRGGSAEGMAVGNSGILATTPSRMQRSRTEMNRGRDPVWRLSPTPSMVRTYARRSLERTNIQCTVNDVRLVTHFADQSPIVEVACNEGLGLMISDTEPSEVASCRVMETGNGVLGPCKLGRNVELLKAMGLRD